MKSTTSRALIFAPLLLQVMPLAASAATIKVPLQQPTIQAAINAAVAGDIVQVSPGTYVENINFNGKAISVLANRGPRAVIINGGGKGNVVTFSSGETSNSILSGFTLINGNADVTSNCGGEGGGICVSESSPTIEYNTIKNNSGCSGAGMAITFASPTVTGNLITNNVQGGCSGGTGGGGILVRGAGSARITNNIIQNNSMSSADGGGISLFAAGTPIITGNIIRSNASVAGTCDGPGEGGGGITMANQADATVAGNLITGNTARCGAGIYALVPSENRGPFLVNNTIADNPGGAGVDTDGFDTTSQLINNIIVGSAGQPALYCGTFSTATPVVKYNDIYTAGGSAYGGNCIDHTGTSGNISADPLFVSSANQNYHLRSGSPAIDAGSNTAPNLPATDFDGAARKQDGNLDASVIVDLGVDEFTASGSAAMSSASSIDVAPDHGSARAHATPAAVHPLFTTDSSNRRTVMAYDAHGNIVSRTDTNGVKHSLR